MTDAEFEAIEEANAKLLKALDRMRFHMRDVMRYPDEDERESLPYLINSVMDDAHEIIDLAHDFKGAVHAGKK